MSFDDGPQPFDRVARVPAAGDNVAIATRRLEAGTRIASSSVEFTLPHTVLEGHRFVLRPIEAGSALLSWGLPFGKATRSLSPGEYVCNEKILRVLSEREIDLELPRAHNFTDHLEPHRLDEARFVPGRQVERIDDGRTFDGYLRPGERGVGTRNYVVVLGTTVQAAAFAAAVADRAKRELDGVASVDGIVAVTHTEGGGERAPNNLDFVHRALAGFMVHPNVAAVLAVDYGTEPFDNDSLRAFMDRNRYPLAHVRHAFFRVNGRFEDEVLRACEMLSPWLREAARCARSPQPLSTLRLALQCGGSDAFSGISGNALAGWVAKALIRRGGSACLAETDELIGAEPYVLSNVRDLDTARRFLDKIEIFKRRVADHGATAEGNPSGGNNYRGLYNIALKSIGAARKKDPEVRLDFVVDYGGRMSEGGYYFMDSPGNDLESIAGQVASGSNLILFITGNGSITNFPFVPTLKFVTTTGRFRMLESEMDVNAGRYNDGLSMDALGEETFDLALRVASGERSKGELAGHAQVQLWRDWPQRDASRLAQIRAAPRPRGEAIAVRDGAPSAMRLEGLRTEHGHAFDRVGLIMPTSLCAGQVARLIAVQMNARATHPGPVSRYVALAHTEGCGTTNSHEIYLQTLLGHLRHRSVRCALLLEHGCEKTHNDAVRRYLRDAGVDPARFGFASVQLDGGIEKVTARVIDWFDAALAAKRWPQTEWVGVEALSLGLAAFGEVPDAVAAALAELARRIVSGGGTVVVPRNARLLGSRAFDAALLAPAAAWRETLAYGQPVSSAGLHVAESPTEVPLETFTGLAGNGVELMLAYVGRAPLQSHPFVPLLQISALSDLSERFADDLDLRLASDGALEIGVAALETLVADTVSRRYRPRLFAQGVTGFQVTRGLLGVST